MTTNNIPSISLIDGCFEQNIVASLPPNATVAPTICSAGVLRPVYDQREEMMVLFDPLSGSEHPFTLNNSFDILTFHVVTGGKPSTQQQFGYSYENSYSANALLIVIAFSKTSYLREALLAIESCPHAQTIAFELDTESVLNRYAYFKPNNDIHYPPYTTAFAISYQLYHLTLTDHAPTV